MGTEEFNAGGNPMLDEHPIQGGVETRLGVYATETGYPMLLLACFTCALPNAFPRTFSKRFP